MAQNVRPYEIRPDPILTDWAVQYGTGADFVSDAIAPVMNVPWSEYKYPRYLADMLDQDEKVEVAPGDKPNSTTFRKPSFVTSSTFRRALDSQLNREIKLVGMGPLASERVHVQKITHRLKLRVEKSIKTLLDAGSYSATPTVKWDGTNPTIEKDIDTAKEAFELRCGVPATHLVMPRAVANVVKRDSSVRGLRKFQNDGLLLDGEIPSTIFGLNVVIPGALENTANPGLSQSLARIWTTDTCYLVHVNPAIGQDGETLTTVAQMRWAAWGTPYAAFTWPDAHLSKRVDWVSVDVHQNEELVAPFALYLLTDVLA